MNHVSLDELRWFSRAVHAGRAWLHVQALAKALRPAAPALFVAKLQSGEFYQVLKTGRVLFDKRDGWVLLSAPIGSRKRTDIRWIHPSETPIDWIRPFRF